MRKYLLLAFIISVFMALWLSPFSLNTALFSLLVLGVIPGTNVDLGITLPIVAGGGATMLVRLWLRQLSNELMDFKTEAAIREQKVNLRTKTIAHPIDQPSLGTEKADLLSI